MKHFVVRRASKKYPEDKVPADDAMNSPAALRDRVRKLAADSFPELVTAGDDELTFATVLDALIAREKANPAVASEIDLFERWASVHRFVPAAHAGVAGWVSFHFPHFVDHEDLRAAAPARREAARHHRGPARAPAAPRRVRADRPAHVAARGRERGRLLPLLPRAREGFLLDRHARQVGRGEAQPAGREDRRAARSTRRSARCTCCGRTAIRSRRWR